MTREIKKILGYTIGITVLSALYFVYVKMTYPRLPENETILSEIGEGFGTAGLWLLGIIYGRTLLKLVMGKGKLAKRLLPDYTPPKATSYLKRFLLFLNKTHIYVGIAAVAIILLHIAMVGIPMNILFFPAVLALVLWQGFFGMFISWKYSPKELRKFSYLVHAQLMTGILIGIFAYFGHMAIDN